MNLHADNKYNAISEVQLRQFPYPYRAMLAICSDLDETSNGRVYWEIMRFLNTTDETSMGEGVGLEVGNSIYFYETPDQFSYWNADDKDREMVKLLIKSGHIDCLHSYGELAKSRANTQKALEELIRSNCKIEVWVDHGRALSNFGKDIMGGHGDEADHEVYHADLTRDYGIKYVWRGRVTSVLGQDIPANFYEIFNWKHPVVSGRTVLKEVVKQKLAKSGHEKYLLHGTNETLQKTFLRDGQPMYEFLRCNPHWGGVSSCDQGRCIGEVLTTKTLNGLIDKGGSCIFYTHLGKVDSLNVPFNEMAVGAFRQLAKFFRDGKILVTTTRRLLGYRRAMSEVKYEYSADDKGLQIDINTKDVQNFLGEIPQADLCGLSFYVLDPSKTRVSINGKSVENLVHNAPDHTGRSSVSLAWSFLEFPAGYKY